MRRLAWLANLSLGLVVAASLGVAGAAATGPKREKAECAKCGDTKRVPCPTHDRRSTRYKAFCSADPEPACCKGVGWTPCPRCADDETRKKFDQAAATYAKEREGKGFYPWGEGFLCAASEHFRFKAAGTTHAECHEFQAVAEKAFSLFQRTFGEKGVGQLSWDEKAHFLIVLSREQYHAFLDWYCESRRSGNPNEKDFLKGGPGVRMITDRLHVLIRGETQAKREDKAMFLHRIAHGAGHLAIENYKVHGNTPDWLGEGWACRSEIEALREPCVYCIQYVAGGPGERKPQEWRQTVRDAIRRKTIPTLEKFFSLKVGEMGVVEWATSISVVSWLLEQFPDKVVGVVDALKEGKGSKDALEGVLGKDLATLEKAWQRWAMTH
jgi:hypothetical protein